MLCSYVSIVLSAPLGLSIPSYKNIDDAYDQFGPTPRICLQLSSNPLDWEHYKDDVRYALTEVTLQKLQELTKKSKDLNMDFVSHKLCLIRREDRDIVSSAFLVMPITDHIRSRLAIRMRNYDMDQLIETFELFSSVASLREMSGIIFENICHQRFQKQILLKYMLMVRLARDDRSRQPRWYSSHRPIDQRDTKGQELESLRRDAFDRCETLDLSPSDTREYDDLDFALESNVYYIPMKPNQVAVDSFICYGGYLYLFQFTVSEERKINDGLISQFATCRNLPPPRNWRYIFVIPDGVKTLVCPYPKSPGIQELRPCSSQVVVEDFAKPPEQKPPLSINGGGVWGEQHPRKRMKVTETPDG